MDAAPKSKLNRFFSNRDWESTESGWNRRFISIGTPQGTIAIAYGIDCCNRERVCFWFVSGDVGEEGRQRVGNLKIAPLKIVQRRAEERAEEHLKWNRRRRARAEEMEMIEAVQADRGWTGMGDSLIPVLICVK
ncbi:hypothetical protein LXL04_028708 [Taraxacum kok-saghyz]